MIRVLHMIGELNIGGSQAMVMNLYRSIDKRKVQFDFIVDQPGEMFFYDEIINLGGRIFCLPKENNILKIKKRWDDFFDEHSEYKILHSHVRSYASLFIPVAKKHGVKTIIHSHSTSNGEGIKSLIKAFFQYPLRYQADYFFGCSKEAGKWLFGKKIVNGDKFYTIKNAVDIEKLRFSEKKREVIFDELGISKDAVVFGHIGRLHESKNHLFLLDIFSCIYSNNKNAVLLIVGDGELKVKIIDKIEKLGIKSSVKMLGARNDIDKLLSSMDMLLFPSKWEGLPVTVIEAQAAGLTCFVSNAITKEINISKSVHMLPIDRGIQVWVDEILSTDIKKNKVEKEIIEAGYSIKDTCAWIENFYMNI